MDEHYQELRRIRITLIVFVVIFALSSGGREIILENNNDNVPAYQNEMVPLGDGHFGILMNDATWADNGRLNIFHYDASTNEVTLKKEMNVDELLYE